MSLIVEQICAIPDTSIPQPGRHARKLAVVVEWAKFKALLVRDEGSKASAWKDRGI
jgi:hypothetical protein